MVEVVVLVVVLVVVVVVDDLLVVVVVVDDVVVFVLVVDVVVVPVVVVLVVFVNVVDVNVVDDAVVVVHVGAILALEVVVALATSVSFSASLYSMCDDVDGPSVPSGGWTLVLAEALAVPFSLSLAAAPAQTHTAPGEHHSNGPSATSVWKYTQATFSGHPCAQ